MLAVCSACIIVNYHIYCRIFCHILVYYHLISRLCDIAFQFYSTAWRTPNAATMSRFETSAFTIAVTITSIPQQFWCRVDSYLLLTACSQVQVCDVWFCFWELLPAYCDDILLALQVHWYIIWRSFWKSECVCEILCPTRATYSSYFHKYSII